MITTSTGVRHVESVMGTMVSIDLREPRVGEVAVRRALADAVAWLHHVDHVFSTYRADSEISRLGRGDLRVGEASTEVRDVLQTCVEIGLATDGAFDAFALPAANGTRLDPSGYVKGWALERAAAMLERDCSDHLCVNGGGDVAVRGRPAPDRAWRVGIRHPGLADQLAAWVQLDGFRAIATSATYERGAHIVDPRLNHPVTEIASATVLGADLGITDAYATAVFVMGVDGIAWIERQAGFEAFVITHEGTTVRSSGWPDAA
jgi:thiamine biosynthesis lipoprotein